MAWRHVTDGQWVKIAATLPPPKPKPKGGRPPLADRQCFEGLLWVLWTGAPWSELPRRYGAKSAVHRRLSRGARDGTLLHLWRGFVTELADRDKIRWDECFIDGTFVVAKKGGPWSGPPSAARERSSWYWPMARVLRSEFTWTRRPRRR